MKINKIQFAVLLVTLLLVGSLLHGIFDRLSPGQTVKEMISSSGPAGKVLPKATSIDGANDKRTGWKSSEEKLQRNFETLAQQVSVLVSSVESLQDQIKILSVRKGTETDHPPGGVDSMQEESAMKTSREVPREPLYNRQMARFDDEIRDSAWASAIEKDIIEQYTTDPNVAEISINEIECRATLCRMSWQFPEGMTNEESFITENEMMAAIGKAGFNTSSLRAFGGGVTEGIFWYQPPPSNGSSSD